MHSVEIPEGKLVSPLGVLGMLRINTQMPFCERFDSVRVNESIFLLGGRLILAPRVPIIPHQPPLAYQLFRERKSATTQFNCHGAPPKKVGAHRSAISTADLARCPFDDFRRQNSAMPRFSSRVFFSKLLRIPNIGKPQIYRKS
jgi:hypothetical protein